MSRPTATPEHARAIWQAAVAAVDPFELVCAALAPDSPPRRC